MSESVIGLVFDADKILIVQRRDTGVWVLPGGGIDKDESPEEAIIREVKEESGYTVKIIRKVAEYMPYNSLSKVTHCYLCEVVSGVATINDEAKGVGFYPIRNLPRPFFFIHEGWIKEVMHANGVVIKRTLNEVNYWALAKFMLKNPVIFFRFLLSRMGFPINSD